jgi:hypothetical protein
MSHPLASDPRTALNAAAFAYIGLTLARIYGCSITSWLRTPKRNTAVGGAATSWHLLGLAMDLVPDDPATREQLIRAAKTLGLQVADEGDHIHIECDYAAI